MEADGKPDMFSRPGSKGVGKRAKIDIVPSRLGKRAKRKQQQDNVSESQRPEDDSDDDGFNNYDYSHKAGRNSSSKKFVDVSSKSSASFSRGNDSIRAFNKELASVRGSDSHRED